MYLWSRVFLIYVLLYSLLWVKHHLYLTNLQGKINPPLVVMLKNFGCVSVRDELNSYLNDRVRAGNFITWVHDKNKIYDIIIGFCH